MKSLLATLAADTVISEVDRDAKSSKQPYNQKSWICTGPLDQKHYSTGQFTTSTSLESRLLKDWNRPPNKALEDILAEHKLTLLREVRWSEMHLTNLQSGSATLDSVRSTRQEPTEHTQASCS